MNQVQTNRGLKDMLNDDYVKARFGEVLGAKAPAFLASVLNATRVNKALLDCEPGSVMSAAMVAASLDLPIDGSLGFAAIIPYKSNGSSVAQFQIMYKGFIQLALRTGQYSSMHVGPIYADEYQGQDIITGEVRLSHVAGGFRDHDKQDKVAGYVAHFKLVNGFEKVAYWSLDKIKAHGKRYSKSYGNQYGLWTTDPHAMYAKTVLKNTLSKWGILSTTMQMAIKVDQASIHDFDGKLIEDSSLDYVDRAEPETEAVTAIAIASDPARIEAAYTVLADYVYSGMLTKKQEASIDAIITRGEKDIIILEDMIAKAKAAHDKALEAQEGKA